MEKLHITMIGCALLALLATSCVEPIAFESVETEALLVVDGRFTSARAPHFLRLSYSNRFGAGPGLPVLGARATLSDQLGNSEAYVELGDGNYRLDGSIVQGVAGRAYALEFSLPDGRLYRSEPQVLPAPIRADSLKIGFEQQEYLNQFDNLVRRNVINIYIDTPSQLPNGEPGRLRWKTEDAFSFQEIDCGLFDSLKTCYIVDQDFDPQRIEVYSGAATGGAYLEHQLVGAKFFSPLSYEFTFEHYFTTYQYSLSEESYAFWAQAAIIANPAGSVFDAQAANPAGNVFNVDETNEKVLGLFEVAAVDTIRTLVIRQQVEENLYQAPYCQPGFNGDPPDACCECILLPESSYRKPDYWR